MGGTKEIKERRGKGSVPKGKKEKTTGGKSTMVINLQPDEGAGVKTRRLKSDDWRIGQQKKVKP